MDDSALGENDGCAVILVADLVLWILLVLAVVGILTALGVL